MSELYGNRNNAQMEERHANENLVVEEQQVREKLSANHNETLVEEQPVREKLSANHNESFVSSPS